VRDKDSLAYLRCFGPGHVRALSDSLVEEFALAGRAPPAHVEALGGRAVGGPLPVSAKTSGPVPRL
jgi:hypothetical protein